MQKGLTYKRLFATWKDKASRSQDKKDKLTEKEIQGGLKKLKAGLTTDEIEKLSASLTYDIKDHTISAAEFEEEVRGNARKLEAQKSFERMILQEWIT
jgi:hypothetical protein